ncbi:Phosphohistidine phosphatase SixA [Pseudomonas agarici]|nr:Phosphohistidine phosphatase SixA [Pseudomonas agarici]
MVIPDVMRPVIQCRFKPMFLAGAIALMALLMTGFALWPKSHLDLALNDPMSSASVYAHWKAGDIIVLVRHAERCDRSSHACLGPEDGITRLGSRSAVDVGQAFQAVGMDNTDVLSSPTTRTTQTAQAMFGKTAISADWLLSCGPALGRDAVAHKAAHRNLVLVTHSGCIDDLEKELGYRHEVKSEYTSSILVSVGADGQLKMLGVINAENWQTTLGNKKMNGMQ